MAVNPWAEACKRRRPKRIAKKIRKRRGAQHFSGMNVPWDCGCGSPWPAEFCRTCTRCGGTDQFWLICLPEADTVEEAMHS